MQHKGAHAIREAYRDEGVARHYIDERFRQPLGRLLHERQAEALRQTLARLAPTRVLEIAPGPARLTTEVAPFFDGAGIVMDASAQMLDVARQRLRDVGAPRWRCVQGDAFVLPFAERFDLVYSFRLIRHFEQDDRVRIYRAIAGALRPGGTLVFDAVNRDVSEPLRAKDPDSYKHYDGLVTPDELRAELAQAGLTIESLEGVQHRYDVLRAVQVLVAPRAEALAWQAVRLVDRLGGAPLEWIVTCRKS